MQNDSGSIQAQSQIVEVQFLLKWLLKAKKIGHKYYGIKRRQQFINSVSNEVYNNNSNYQLYKNKIMTLITDNNISQFCKELFIKPNIILSMTTKVRQFNLPLLWLIGRYENFKMFELWLDCLLHLNDIILFNTNNNNNKNIFLRKYLKFHEINVNPQSSSIVEYYTYMYTIYYNIMQFHCFVLFEFGCL